MRKLILIAALAAASIASHAGTVGYLNGVRLQDTQSTCPRGALYVITKFQDDTWLGGCWTMVGDKVFILYSNRTTAAYSARAFSRVTPGLSNPTAAWGEK